MKSINKYINVWSALLAECGSDQPGMVAIPAHGQLDRGKYFFCPCPRPRLRLESREAGSPVPSRPASARSSFTSRLDLVLTHECSRFPRRCLPLPVPSTVIRYRVRVSPELMESCNCVPMAFTAESPPAQGQ